MSENNISDVLKLESLLKLKGWGKKNLLNALGI